MSVFVLVHGGWAGSWSWEKLAPLLRAAGHRVVTVDLPGRAGDETPLGEVAFENFVGCVVNAIDREADPVVLLGHSSSGMVVTQVAERRPERVQSLVYLCAYLPRDGESLFHLGSSDTEQLILPNLIMSEDQTAVGVRSEVVREALFADCDDEDYRNWIRRMVPREPTSLAMTPVRVTPERFGSVDRIYVECLADRAISPALQRRMVAASPCRHVITMETSHSPHYADPHTLADHLDTICG